MKEQKHPFPPFNEETASQKVRMAEDAWNLKDANKISFAYTHDSRWRNRDLFINGRKEIVSFLNKKFEKEKEYRLCKEIWGFRKNRIAVRFAYEWHDESGQWWRSYGNENWEFDEKGLMKIRLASINDLAINENERKLIWDGNIRPDGYNSLSEMGL